MVIPYAVFCCCCLDMFSIHLGIYQRAQWFHYMGRVWFSFVRNCQTVFQNFAFLQASCIPMEKNRPAFPPAMNESFPIDPHPCKHLVLSVFWILAMLRGVQWYLTVVLTYIFLIKYDFEHLFIYLFVIYLSSLGRCLLRFVAHF